MRETTQDIFLKIAQQKGLLHEDWIEEAIGLQTIDRMRGRDRSIESILVEQEYLSVDQVKGLLRGVRYYVIRKNDRRYGRSALRLGLIGRPLYSEALRRQKRAFHERNVLVRLSALLLHMGVIDPEQDQAIRDELLASRTPSGRTRRTSQRSARLISQRSAAIRDARDVARSSARLFEGPLVG
ncbi:MAG: hypothetical protein ACYTFT_09940 [Planctomycetota bacterium]